MSKKWEYKVEDFFGMTRERRQEILNEMGDKNWKLINVAKNGAAYFRRKKIKNE